VAVIKAKSTQGRVAQGDVDERPVSHVGANPVALDPLERLIAANPIPLELEEMPRNPPLGRRTMYAIALDLDTEDLQASYPTASFKNAYGDIKKRLIEVHGFSWQQGSVYFGGPNVNAVSCVMAAIDLRNTFPWFAASVRDIRMLRIEEQNDLMPAVAGP
jgi:virulence-associated protein VapD